MTYLDAAYEILKQAGQPLRYEQITELALARHLISPQGLTPEATMASRLYTDTLQEGSRFVRAGKGVFGLVQWQPSGIDEQVRTINRGVRERLQQYLLEMPPDRFEALIGELLLRMGFDENTVEVTKRSGDGGIDVTGVFRAAGLTEVNAAVQVKRWKRNVQAPTVTGLRGSLQVHQQGIIITTSDFSKGARQEAAAPNKTHIGLINGDELLELLIKSRVGVVEKNLTVLSLDEEWWGELTGQAQLRSETIAAPSAGPGETLADEPVAKERSIREKPAGFVLFGKEYPANTWRGALLGVAEALAAEHPDTFPEVAVTVRGPRRQHIADTAEGMIDPVPIAGTGLWLEANQSSRTAMRVVEMLLEAFGYPPDAFQVI